MILSIVLPAYKEAENLVKILPEIHNQVKMLNVDYEILIIDTMNPIDNTKEICNRFDAVYINRSGGDLYGDAIRTGINAASGKYVVMMDADGSHEPKSIIDLYRAICNDECDLVIGSRYCKGGKTDNSFVLKTMSYILNLTYRVIFGLNVKDCSNSFRIYNAKLLSTIKLECDNFDIVEEILIKLYKKYPKLRVQEVPIYFKKREKGISKRDLVKFIFSYVTTIKRLLTIKNT